MVFGWELVGRIQINSLAWFFSLSFSTIIGLWGIFITLAQAVLYRRRALEIYEFEYRLKKKHLLWNLLAFSAQHGISVDCAKINIFNSKTFLQIKKLSINTLMEEVKPVLLKNWNFEWRDRQKFFNFLVYHDSDGNIKIHHFSLNNPPQVKRDCLSLWWKNLTRVCGEVWVRKRRCIFWSHFWHFRPVTYQLQ